MALVRWWVDGWVRICKPVFSIKIVVPMVFKESLSHPQKGRAKSNYLHLNKVSNNAEFRV